MNILHNIYAKHIGNFFFIYIYVDDKIKHTHTHTHRVSATSVLPAANLKIH